MKGYKPVCTECGHKCRVVENSTTVKRDQNGREVRVFHIGRISNCCAKPIQWEMIRMLPTKPLKQAII